MSIDVVAAFIAGAIAASAVVCDLMSYWFDTIEAALSHFDPWPWKYFHPQRDTKMACSKTGRLRIVPAFLDRMDRLREEFGHPIIINSWYRSSEYNVDVSSTGPDGPHTTGRAVDVCVYGKRASRLIQLAFIYGFTGIGIRQTGPYSGRFIHLDDLDDDQFSGPRPWIWSYA